MKKPLLLVGTLSAAALLSLPSAGTGFALLGGSLGVATVGNGYQRDVRSFFNGADAGANDNNVANPLFPGALGAAQAIWKASKGWASDTAQAQKNFDFDWQGTATTAGSVNDNIVSWVSSCGGGTLAFTQSPISDGWTIKVCDEWTWSDNPGNPPFNQIDIQGVVTHELGHALGLDHSNVNCNNCNDTASGTATMCPAICGTGTVQRTIAADDAAGLQAIYGVIPANKPKITSLSGNFNPGQTLVINGQNFAATVNVKFTAGTTQNTGAIPGVVTGVATNGTQLSVTIPVAAKDGNVFVWEPSLGLLSNGFPIDIGSAPPPPPQITGISPPNVPAFPEGGTLITITGLGFTGASQVNSGSTILTAGFTVVNDNTITYASPEPTSVGPVNVNVTVPLAGTSNNGSFTYVDTIPPKLVANTLSVGGQPFVWDFGGPANHLWFIILAINDPTTFPFGADPVLLNAQTYFSGVLNPAGIGTQNIVMPMGLGNFDFYSQVVTFDGIATLRVSNITQTHNLL